MGSLFWHLANRTAETEFIFNLFHFLLAGLTVLVLLHQLRARRAVLPESPYRLLTIGFLLLSLYFALLGLSYGIRFFLYKELVWTGAEFLSDGLLVCALLVISAGYVAEYCHKTALVSWLLRGCALVPVMVVAAYLLRVPNSPGADLHSAPIILCNDLLGVLAVALALIACRGQVRRASAIALSLIGIALALQHIWLFLPHFAGILVWNTERHLLSIALFAFAWDAGERYRNLLDQIFVRLNLTFIILAGVLMFAIAGMEKYQYLRMTEQRCLEFAEFLRGHIVYYGSRGERLDGIFRRPEVIRRVVIEFGRMPELRQINIFLEGTRATFHYTAAWEVQQEFAPAASVARAGPADSFEMIRLPIRDNPSSDRIELVGTMEFINGYIGKYIILIYSVFTSVVFLATGMIGMIVTDTDRKLRLQYAELQQTHQQLTQAAKLASVGELAGGMAHEINSPITSILALATHLAEGKSAGTLAAGQRQSLKLIAQQAQRVSNVVRNLLTFSRQSHLELSQMDIGELLDMSLTLVQHRLADERIRVCREIDADLSPILGDAGRLTEVFVNVLNNALDAMPEGGTLLVRAVPNPDPEGGVQVEVSDTGCGISPQDLPRIFDPFFTTKLPGRGTGLGLSISHGIIKDHGGQIRARSSPGTGTTLIVILPKEVQRDGTAHPGD